METIEKVLSIIQLLSKGPAGVTEISKQMGIGKSTVSRTLSALAEEQWVVQDPDTQRFKLGFKMVQLSLSILSQLDMRGISLPYMNELRRATNETIILSMRVDMERVTIEQIQSTLPIRGVVGLGQRFPLWMGATGKVMLAYLPTREIEEALAIVGQGDYTLRSGKRVDPEALREELGSIRLKGFAAAFEEVETGTGSVSAPIFGRGDVVAGALSIIGPGLRLSPQVESFGGLLIEAARKISLELGAGGGIY